LTYAVGFGDGEARLVAFTDAETTEIVVCELLRADVLDKEAAEAADPVTDALLVELRALELNEELELNRELESEATS
jgi:hypothetical protein